MDKKLFAELVESMTESGEIARGERAPARKFTVDEPDVRRIRKASGLSQAKFARLIHVELSTLRNWEQGRRAPTGPAPSVAARHRKGSPVRPARDRVTGWSTLLASTEQVTPRNRFAPSMPSNRSPA